MSKTKVLITRIIPETGLQLIREKCDTEIWENDLPPTKAELISRIMDVEGILCLLTDRVDAAVMQAAPKLKVISNMAVGVDNIDVAEATRRGVPVGNTPGVLTEATADMAFALLMAAARRVVEGNTYVRAGRWRTWEPKLLLGVDFSRSTLGLIGFGRIGQAVAKRAQGFEMNILYHDPTAYPAFGAVPVELDVLLQESDFISVHVPLTTETKYLINRETLAKVKPSAVLVNTARGGVVELDALHEALKSQRLFAAALDVTDPEPLPNDHPLLELDNCIVIPHIASASRRTREKMAVMAAQNLIAGIKGERLPNCVNPETYRDQGGKSD